LWQGRPESMPDVLPLSINRCLRYVKIWMYVDTI
jgi:hypothetical protein